MDILQPNRRVILAAALLFGSAPRVLAEAPAPPRRDVAFTVWRKGAQIGRHHVSFEGGPDDFRVQIEADMRVLFGPIPVFHYHHQATERWQAGVFETLQSRTTSNGKIDAVSAHRTPQGVIIARGGGRPDLQASPDAHPLTHWNAAVLEAPLFNPQTGALLHDHVARTAGQMLKLDGRDVPATRYVLTGDAQITDWYDGDNVWAALMGRAPDGSTIEYRRDS